MDDEALGILRELIEKVAVRARESAFEIEFVGALANMLALPAVAQSAQSTPFRRSVKVVAGDRLRRFRPGGLSPIPVACIGRYTHRYAFPALRPERQCVLVHT